MPLADLHRDRRSRGGVSSLDARFVWDPQAQEIVIEPGFTGVIRAATRAAMISAFQDGEPSASDCVLSPPSAKGASARRPLDCGRRDSKRDRAVHAYRLRAV